MNLTVTLRTCGLTLATWSIVGWACLMGAGCASDTGATPSTDVQGTRPESTRRSAPDSTASPLLAARAWLSQSPADVEADVRWLLERIASNDESADATRGRIERLVRSAPDTYVAVVSAGGQRAVLLTLTADGSDGWRVASADNGRSRSFWPRVGE